MLDFKPARNRPKRRPSRRVAKQDKQSRNFSNSAVIRPKCGADARKPRVMEVISPGAFALTATKAVCVLLAAWLVLGLGVESVALWHSPLSKIEISGNRSHGAQELAAAAGIASGQPLGEVDSFFAAVRLAALPNIESADLRRVFPGQVFITVRERAPVGIVRTSPEFRFLIDKTGRVLAQAPEVLPASMRALPQIDYALSRAAPGNRLAGRSLAQALQLISHGEWIGLGQGEDLRIDLNRRASLVLHLPERKQQVILPSEGLELALNVYPSLKAAVREDFPKTRIIDLRAVGPAHGARVFLRR